MITGVSYQPRLLMDANNPAESEWIVAATDDDLYSGGDNKDGTFETIQDAIGAANNYLLDHPRTHPERIVIAIVTTSCLSIDIFARTSDLETCPDCGHIAGG